MTKNEVNIDDVVKEDYKIKESVFNGRFNKTTRFILPMLGITMTNRYMIKYLKNAFLDDKTLEHDFINPVFILFKVKSPNLNIEWQELTRLLTIKEPLKSRYIMDYYVGTSEDGCTLIMFVFKVPQGFVSDFELIKLGKYSKTSNNYKKLFERVVYNASGTAMENREWGILNKSNNVKDEVVKKFIVPETSKPEDVISFRKEIDSWEEIWDSPKEQEEIYYNEVSNIYENAQLHT